MRTQQLQRAETPGDPSGVSNITETLEQKKTTSWSRKENSQKLTQLSPRSHPRHLMGKRTAQKDAIKDITSDSQVNSYFPYRWSPASLTINIYFYLFLYCYITKITINNGTPMGQERDNCPAPTNQIVQIVRFMLGLS